MPRPKSTLAALNLLEELDGNKIAVLGDMLELGPYEEEGHEKVGIRAAEVVSDLVTLGEKGKTIADAAHNAGLASGHIQVCQTTDEIIDFLKIRLTPEDVLLVKGSHGMRMDKIVTALEGTL